MTSPIAQRQAEAIRQILDGQRTELHTAMPGTVVSYDASAQTADIRPGLHDEDETRETLPILPSVPVAWPRSGNFFIHAPLAQGDGVLVIFCEADINAWLGGSTSSDPGTPERHGLSGAVAIPGLFPSAEPIGSADATHPRIGKDDSYKIEFNGDQIRVGGTENIALARGLDALFDAISGAGVTSGDGGAAFKAAILAALAVDPNWTGRASTVIKGA